MELATTKQQNQAMEEQVYEQGFVIQFSLSWVIWSVSKSRRRFVLNDTYMILSYTTSFGPTAHLEGWWTFPIRRSLFRCMLRENLYVIKSALLMTSDTRFNTHFQPNFLLFPFSKIVALEEKMRKLKTEFKRAQDKNKYSEGEVSLKRTIFLCFFLVRTCHID